MKKNLIPFLLLLMLSSIYSCQKTAFNETQTGKLTNAHDKETVSVSRKIAMLGIIPVSISYSQSSGSLAVEWMAATGTFDVTISYGSTTLHFNNYTRTSIFLSGIYLADGATISASVTSSIGDSGSATYTVSSSGGGGIEGPINLITANFFYQHANKLSVASSWSTEGVDNNTRYYFCLRLRSADGYIYRTFNDVSATAGSITLEILGPVLQPDYNEVRFVVSTLPFPGQSTDPDLYSKPIDVNFYLSDENIFSTTYYCSPPFRTYL